LEGLGESTLAPEVLRAKGIKQKEMPTLAHLSLRDRRGDDAAARMIMKSPYPMNKKARNRLKAKKYPPTPISPRTI
jgi:hypothetical protein